MKLSKLIEKLREKARNAEEAEPKRDPDVYISGVGDDLRVGWDVDGDIQLMPTRVEGGQ